MSMMYSAPPVQTKMLPQHVALAFARHGPAGPSPLRTCFLSPPRPPSLPPSPPGARADSTACLHFHLIPSLPPWESGVTRPPAQIRSPARGSSHHFVHSGAGAQKAPSCEPVPVSLAWHLLSTE